MLVDIALLAVITANIATFLIESDAEDEDDAMRDRLAPCASNRGAAMAAAWCRGSAPGGGIT